MKTPSCHEAATGEAGCFSTLGKLETLYSVAAHLQLDDLEDTARVGAEDYPQVTNTHFR